MTGQRGFQSKKLGATLTDIPVIVTGAAGRVGQILRKAWSAQGSGREIAGDIARDIGGLSLHWVARDPTRLSGTGGRDAAGTEWIRWDIGASPPPAWPADAILLHLAGATGAATPELNPALIPPLLEACRQNAVRHLIFLSTAAVYGPGARPARETDIPAPSNAYGAAKLAAERLLAGAQICPVTVLRLGNLAGADALLAPRDERLAAPIRLDPVPGERAADGRGPLRSWIGPITFAATMLALIRQIAAGRAVPPLLNLAQSPPLGMAELLRESGLAWEWGPPNPRLVAAATLDTAPIRALLPLPEARPGQIIAEIAGLNRI